VRFKRCVATDVNDKKIQRLQKIMDESAKQCKRTEIPKIRVPISFDEMMKDLQNNYFLSEALIDDWDLPFGI